MTAARQLVALIKSHVSGDDAHFYSVAMQIAADEARQGHGRVADELKQIIDRARTSKTGIPRQAIPVPLAQPKGELANLLGVRYPDTRLSDMVLERELEDRLRRVLLEQRQQSRLRSFGLAPRRKLLLLGPPGSGKTMTASALAGELRLPLFTVVLDGLISKFMGETAGKLRMVFDAMATTKGVYLFDEFDAIGAKRLSQHDVGEVRRILNSFLQFLEQDASQGLIVAATNHGELLDPALYRRFDDVVVYGRPDSELAERLLRARLSQFDLGEVDWQAVLAASDGLAYADLVRSAEEAAKDAILQNAGRVTTGQLLAALHERQRASERVLAASG